MVLFSRVFLLLGGYIYPDLCFTFPPTTPLALTPLLFSQNSFRSSRRVIPIDLSSQLSRFPLPPTRKPPAFLSIDNSQLAAMADPPPVSNGNPAEPRFDPTKVLDPIARPAQARAEDLHGSSGVKQRVRQALSLQIFDIQTCFPLALLAASTASTGSIPLVLGRLQTFKPQSGSETLAARKVMRPLDPVHWAPEALLFHTVLREAARFVQKYATRSSFKPADIVMKVRTESDFLLIAACVPRFRSRPCACLSVALLQF